MELTAVVSTHHTQCYLKGGSKVEVPSNMGEGQAYEENVLRHLGKMYVRLDTYNVCVRAHVCASLNKWWSCTVKQSMQLVHVPLSSWHNAVLGTQLAKVCYYGTTHSSASSQGSHVSPALHRLPALPLQIWLTELEQDGPPTPTLPS